MPKILQSITPMFLLLRAQTELERQLKSHCRYHGKADAEVYGPKEAQRLLKFLRGEFGPNFNADNAFIRQNNQVIDIHWPNILKGLRQKLQDDQILDFTDDELAIFDALYKDDQENPALLHLLKDKKYQELVTNMGFIEGCFKYVSPQNSQAILETLLSRPPKNATYADLIERLNLLDKLLPPHQMTQEEQDALKKRSCRIWFEIGSVKHVHIQLLQNFAKKPDATRLQPLLVLLEYLPHDLILQYSEELAASLLLLVYYAPNPKTKSLESLLKDKDENFKLNKLSKALILTLQYHPQEINTLVTQISEFIDKKAVLSLLCETLRRAIEIRGGEDLCSPLLQMITKLYPKDLKYILSNAGQGKNRSSLLYALDQYSLAIKPLCESMSTLTPADQIEILQIRLEETTLSTEDRRPNVLHLLASSNHCMVDHQGQATVLATPLLKLITELTDKQTELQPQDQKDLAALLAAGYDPWGAQHLEKDFNVLNCAVFWTRQWLISPLLALIAKLPPKTQLEILCNKAWPKGIIVHTMEQNYPYDRYFTPLLKELRKHFSAQVLGILLTQQIEGRSSYYYEYSYHTPSDNILGIAQELVLTTKRHYPQIPPELFDIIQNALSFSDSNTIFSRVYPKSEEILIQEKLFFDKLKNTIAQLEDTDLFKKTFKKVLSAMNPKKESKEICAILDAYLAVVQDAKSNDFNKNLALKELLLDPESAFSMNFAASDLRKLQKALDIQPKTVLFKPKDLERKLKELDQLKDKSKNDAHKGPEESEGPATPQGGIN